MTKIKPSLFLLSLVLFIASCANNGDSASETAPEPMKSTAIPDQSNVPPEKRLRVGPTPPPAGPEVVAVSFGKGIASGNGLDVTFMHNVNRYKDGTADGEFKQSAMGQAGILDIEADVTCVELDNKEGKGWIGGKVKRNDSTNPLYASAVGADVWFRILDLGAKEQTALISLPSLKQKGIDTAAKFCEEKPWSDDDLLKIDQGALAIFP